MVDPETFAAMISSESGIMPKRTSSLGSELDSAPAAPPPDVQRERIAEVMKLEMRQGQVGGTRDRSPVYSASRKYVLLSSKISGCIKQKGRGRPHADIDSSFRHELFVLKLRRTCVFVFRVRVRFKLLWCTHQPERASTNADQSDYSQRANPLSDLPSDKENILEGRS